VATVAEGLLSPAAKAEADRLLALELGGSLVCIACDSAHVLALTDPAYIAGTRDRGGRNYRRVNRWM
jgi:hypothetical protein